MTFKRSSVRYAHTPVAVTPYQQAHQLWDERIGSARVQAKNWRLMAFGALTLALLVTVGLLWHLRRSTITPYIVEIDSRGQARAVGPATQQYNPTDAQIAHHLARFIVNVRSLPLDPIVLRNNWLDAYEYASGRAAGMLNEHARASNPFASVGKKSVAAEVTSVIRASESSFQVRWIERSYVNGALASAERWTAILSIAMRAPRDAEKLRANPLGIYITGLDWSRELDSTKRAGASL
jgi:type IV secretory pathway TrbF-like protein